MTDDLSQEKLRDLASRWMGSTGSSFRFEVHTDTTDFFGIDYNHIVVIDGRPYLIRQNTKEGRFGVDDEVKYWVKRAIDLSSDERVIIKLVFHETFMAQVGGIEFECFRSPKKEARILKLVADHPNFMHGRSAEDDKGNVVRVLEYIYGPTLAAQVLNLEMAHERYFHEAFPGILDRFLPCIEGIRFLHDQGEKHGDIRRDHIIVDRETEDYRWIDFDYNYRHRENIYGYDLFGLGNILIYLTGKGDLLVNDLSKRNDPVLDDLTEDDINIVFNNRVANLKKIFPYIPDSLNLVLLHFSRGARWYYENAGQLLEDLRTAREDLR